MSFFRKSLFLSCFVLISHAAFAMEGGEEGISSKPRKWCARLVPTDGGQALLEEFFQPREEDKTKRHGAYERVKSESERFEEKLAKSPTYQPSISLLEVTVNGEQAAFLETLKLGMTEVISLERFSIQNFTARTDATLPYLCASFVQNDADKIKKWRADAEIQFKGTLEAYPGAASPHTISLKRTPLMVVKLRAEDSPEKGFAFKHNLDSASAQEIAQALNTRLKKDNKGDLSIGFHLRCDFSDEPEIAPDPSSRRTTRNQAKKREAQLFEEAKKQQEGF